MIHFRIKNDSANFSEDCFAPNGSILRPEATCMPPENESRRHWHPRTEAIASSPAIAARAASREGQFSVMRMTKSVEQINRLRTAASVVGEARFFCEGL